MGYVVRARADAATGTQITNQASIVFDYNPGIATPATLHTIDRGAPSSSVAALPEKTVTYPFIVAWTGQDDEGGSGIARYDVYLSVDGGDFSLWLSTSETSASFNGQPGHTYAFYMVATDNVGNVEAAPATQDATTTISVEVPAGPTLGAITATTITLADLGAGNVGSVQHAIFEEVTGKYVDTDGRLTDLPFWQSADAWIGTMVWGTLPACTEYRFKSKARTAGGAETEFGAVTTAITSGPGDANGDGEVGEADFAVVDAAMGSSPGLPNWDPRADLNNNGVVDTQDRRIVDVARTDINRDGCVDVVDLLYFVDAFGSILGDANYNRACDFNSDGSVDVVDLLDLAFNFGSCIGDQL